MGTGRARWMDAGRHEWKGGSVPRSGSVPRTHFHTRGLELEGWRVLSPERFGGPQPGSEAVAEGSTDSANRLGVDEADTLDLRLSRRLAQARALNIRAPYPTTARC